jgi:hypothetical protein
MLAHVMPLRRKGVRLTKADLASVDGFYGDLTVMPLLDTAVTSRALRVAELRPMNLRERKSGRSLPPLFDPVLVHLKLNRFVLAGFEVHNLYDSRGSVVEYVQGWLVQVAEAE